MQCVAAVADVGAEGGRRTGIRLEGVDVGGGEVAREVHCVHSVARADLKDDTRIRSKEASEERTVDWHPRDRREISRDRWFVSDRVDRRLDGKHRRTLGMDPIAGRALRRLRTRAPRSQHRREIDGVDHAIPIGVCTRIVLRCVAPTREDDREIDGVDERVLIDVTRAAIGE